MPQFLSLGLLPLGFCFILIAGGLLARRRWIAGAGLFVLYAFSTHFVANRLVSSLEKQTPSLSIRECPIADAIVPLGGDDYRLERAVDLLQADRAPLLIVTLDEERLLALDRGVPSSKIVVTGTARNTAAEAAEVSRIARSIGIRKILLVTSALHMPRASSLFTRQGLEVIGFASNYEECWDCNPWMPSAQSLAVSEEALHEIAGSLFDRLRNRG
jgi:uncharacterized SAM-binding protein YcdF (DUF218 family)